VILLFFLACVSCKKDTIEPIFSDNLTFISAVDISSYPEISATDPVFYDFDGKPKDFLEILKENGVNVVRLRLWVNPPKGHSGFEEVNQFSQVLKAKGFKVWLALHYSDTWADPGQQVIPVLWHDLGFTELKERVYTYTKQVVDEINPDFIQIGNEVNSGFLHPIGHIDQNSQNFLELLNSGIQAVRNNSPNTKVIIHYAGIEGSDWFFNLVKQLDFDIIGLSYYPIWHGKSLVLLKQTMEYLGHAYGRDVLIAETAYPFTLDWNDWTNNIVGLEEHLILPDFPASMQGQKEFVKQIRKLLQEVDAGIGFCYWGGELIAWKGYQSTDGSPWENQALFDFQNRALPVLQEF